MATIIVGVMSGRYEDLPMPWPLYHSWRHVWQVWRFASAMAILSQLETCLAGMKVCQCHGHSITVGDMSGRYEGLPVPWPLYHSWRPVWQLEGLPVPWPLYHSWRHVWQVGRFASAMAIVSQLETCLAVRFASAMAIVSQLETCLAGRKVCPSHSILEGDNCSVILL